MASYTTATRLSYKDNNMTSRIDDEYIGAIQTALIEAGYDCRLNLRIDEDQLVINSNIADRKGDPFAIHIRRVETRVTVWQATPMIAEIFDLADPKCFDGIIATVKRWRG